jgi:ZIP family zinc transporter
VGTQHQCPPWPEVGWGAGQSLAISGAEELIPESQQGGHADLATSSALVGFTLMMVLDVAFG